MGFSNFEKIYNKTSEAIANKLGGNYKKRWQTRRNGEEKADKCVFCEQKRGYADRCIHLTAELIQESISRTTANDPLEKVICLVCKHFKEKEVIES